ncbi:GNAT family N-acetyltransferase [Aneurinibacillus uraniidurans]|uniref:GNAT family N-acetyltransferase n=1 Tax=Aneurinibacillus uraniidurans TaxID=2966586 RepID=UPI002349125D|nr:GNAT family N-acetyltransferase [Aneurinibacillus sp. B1]WCN38334.1 GNAT family N-acetyltransferase [Aneurinibacillus sp. B1]
MIHTRNVTAYDTSFLYQAYKEAREKELSQMGWDAEEQEGLLRVQFDMQRRSYALQHLAADHNIILLDTVRIGQIMTKITDRSIWIIDVSLLAEYQNKGIGTRLIHDIQARAEETGKAVRLHVLHNNPAQCLYERLGFYRVGEKFPYVAMEWLHNQTTRASRKEEEVPLMFGDMK